MAQSLIDIIIKATDKASKPIKDVKKELGGMDEAAEDAAETGISLRNALSAVALVAGTVTAAVIVMKKVFDFAEAGAGLQRLETAGDELAAGLGGNFDDIVDAIDKASLGMVARSDIILGANRAMMLQLGADEGKLANLMEVAAYRARAMGLNTSTAFNDIVTGIGRMSPLILDNLGIVIDATTRYGEYAKSVGKSTTELSAAEKKQILFNAVLEEGNEQLEAAGGLVLDAAGEYEKLAATQKDVTDNYKKQVSEGITPWIRHFNHMRDAKLLMIEAVERGIITDEEAIGMQLASKDGAVVWADAIEELTDKIRIQNIAGEQAIRMFGDSVPAIERAAETTKIYTGNVQTLEDAQDDATESARDLKDENYLLILTEEDLIIQTELAKKEIQALAEAHREARDAARDQIAAIEELAQALSDWDAAAQYREIKDAAQEWYDAGIIGEDQLKQIWHDAGVELEIYTEANWQQGEALTFLKDMYPKIAEDVGTLKDAQDLAIGTFENTEYSAQELITALREEGLASDYAAERTELMVGMMNETDLGPAISQVAPLADYLGEITGMPTSMSFDYTVTTTYKQIGNPPSFGGPGLAWGGGGVSSFENVWEGEGGVYDPAKKIGGATGLDMIVPQGYPNDSFPIWAQSGEHVKITPPGQSSGGNVTMYNTFTVPNEATARAVAKELARELNRQGVVA